MMMLSSSNDGNNQRVKPQRYQLTLYRSSSIIFGVLAAAVSIGFFRTDNVLIRTNIDHVVSTTMSIWIAIYWSLSQWVPSGIYNDINQTMNAAAWDFWESDKYYYTSNNPSNASSSSSLEEIPIVYIQDHAIDDLLPYIESMYGKNWRRRPLLLKGLWKLDELMITPNTGSSTNESRDHSNNNVNTTRTYRRLSLHGLLQENLTIPYFTDARKVGAITPDGIGTIQDIVTNITHRNAPHKIATQLLLQNYPELIEEVAPLSIITKLFDHQHFGSSSSYYFTPNAIRGSNGPMQLFPKLTTVPLFVANSHPLPSDITTNSNSDKRPHTALHCEPIGNIAVQLSGEKLWTLIRPEYSMLLRPYIAPDGRAFFASSLPISQITNNRGNGKRIPYYQAITEAGDALWVPTWTWHRVDYVASSSSLPRVESKPSTPHDPNHLSTESNVQQDRKEHSSNIAIGASIFHFRPLGFIQNNPLFALLIVPAIMLELIGVKTQ
jgi:Cupin-like domain